jgi:hypothetical protein
MMHWLTMSLLCLYDISGTAQATPYLPQGTYRQDCIIGYTEEYTFNKDSFEMRIVNITGMVYGRGKYKINGDTVTLFYDSIPKANGLSYSYNKDKKPYRVYRELNVDLRYLWDNSPVPLVNVSVIDSNENPVASGMISRDGKVNLHIPNRSFAEARQVIFESPVFAKTYSMPIVRDTGNIFNVQISYEGDKDVSYMRPHTDKFIISKIEEEGFRMRKPGADKKNYCPYVKVVEAFSVNKTKRKK